MMLGLTAVLITQTDRNIATQRQRTSAGLSDVESGIDRLLLQMSRRHNSILLNKDFDPINPQTSRAYLGADGVPNSGDETATALNDWDVSSDPPTDYPCYQQAGIGDPDLPTSFTGSLIGGGSYRLLAYRYDPYQQVGHLLVEGTRNGQTHRVLVTVGITPDLQNFPGVAVQKDRVMTSTNVSKLILRGRLITGTYANVYYPAASSDDPSQIGIVRPTDSARPNYLSAIWSGASDGAPSDPISGKLLACNLDLRDYPDYSGNYDPPLSTAMPNLGTINTSQTLTGVAGTITNYRVERIDLRNNDTLTVDTTAGAVHLYFPYLPGVKAQRVDLRDNAKIRNIRTDALPPRVGDLRIHMTGYDADEGDRLRMYNTSCIENAFIFAPYAELSLLTTAGGCPTNSNANIVGVIWLEGIFSSKNAAGNRNQNYMGDTEHNTTITPGATSGIQVAEDVSSLFDILKHVRAPIRYQIGPIQKWQQVR
jgi:hypothetical protein